MYKCISVHNYVFETENIAIILILFANFPFIVTVDYK